MGTLPDGTHLLSPSTHALRASTQPRRPSRSSRNYVKKKPPDPKPTAQVPVSKNQCPARAKFFSEKRSWYRFQPGRPTEHAHTKSKGLGALIHGPRSRRKRMSRCIGDGKPHVGILSLLKVVGQGFSSRPSLLPICSFGDFHVARDTIHTILADFHIRGM